MANRLAQETSPYLLQHRDNPVDWYPWGPEALERAREQDRPILLSVGYSACHWCHVMERESFEDPETAAYMNEHFVNVKVDREERPDVDAIYMEAVQAISGQGGWPMTVFLDPEGVPFYGGTYFPPDEGRGMPSFRMVMEAVVDAFERKREEIRERAAGTRARLGAIGLVEPSPEPPQAGQLEEAVARLRASADRERGGFGGAPKFPPASALELLLARGEREIVERTLDAMLAGGIYDQIGGGFARYSVDADWLVPHFEKMLYDNALLARAYLHGWQALGHERYRRVTEETLDWMLREMRGPEGGFYSAFDADSEGEEGRFYVWTPAQIRAVLGEGAESVIAFYGVSEGGNFEGANVLHLAAGAAVSFPLAYREESTPIDLDEARRALYEARAKRVWPGLDDKRLTSWNALAIAALAEAGAVLGRDDYLDAARRLRRVRPRRAHRRRGPAPAHLQGRRRPPQRLPRGPRLPARGSAHPLRSHLRATLVRARPRARRRHRRALRRQRARRLLLHLRRPRGADRPPQGDRRPPDPLRQQLGGDGDAAPDGAERRAQVRAPGRRRLPALRQTGDPAPRVLRPPAPRPRLPPLANQGGGAGRRRPGSSWRRRFAATSAPILSLPADRRAARSHRSCASAPWSRANPPPTSAKTSPVGPR